MGDINSAWSLTAVIVMGILMLIRDFFKTVQANKLNNEKEVKIAEIKASLNNFDRVQEDLRTAQEDIKNLRKHLNKARFKNQKVSQLIEVFSVGFNLFYRHQAREFKDEPDSMHMLEDLKKILDEFSELLAEE